MAPFIPPFLAGLLFSAFAARSRSPWAPSEWKISINIGREPGTYMPDDFGASGARLSLPNLVVLVESETYLAENERDFLGGTGKAYDRMSVLEDPTFVSMEKGEQTVAFEDDGPWRIASRRGGKPGDACRLRFFLDVAEKEKKEGDSNDSDRYVRNDVYLSTGERLYFTCNCWRESELEKGLKRYRPIREAYDRAQREIDERLPHATGDRRLDGSNPIDTAMASIDMAGLVKNRDDKLYELRDAQRRLPPTSSNVGVLSKPGYWPGSDEMLFIAKGKVSVKREGEGIFGDDEYHIVGTWTAAPLLPSEDNGSDIEYEYYDDDDEEDDDDGYETGEDQEEVQEV